MVGATNRPEDIDPAILRPGRLSTHLEIGLPDEESRHAILQARLKDVPHNLTGNQQAELASHTSGFSGADIEELVTDAKRRAARRAARNVSIEDFPTVRDLDGISESIHPEPSGDDDSSDIERTTAENIFDDDSGVEFR